MEDGNDIVSLEPIKWSFLARTKNCPAQQWHVDDDYKDHYFMVMPLYPCGKNCNYSLSVVKGSHNILYDTHPTSERTCEDMRKYLDENILHLKLKVGQVLIAHANLWHRGGPNSKKGDLLGTCNFTNEPNKIPAIKNLSIHGYFRNGGTDVTDGTMETDKTRLINLPKPKKMMGKRKHCKTDTDRKTAF